MRLVVPADVIDRPKGYFPVPALTHLEGPYLDLVHDALHAPAAKERGLNLKRMANLATKAGVEVHRRLKIHTPLLHLSKAEIVKLGQELGLDFGMTFSCYDPDAAGRPCGQCDACLLRRKGFEEAGLADR